MIIIWVDFHSIGSSLSIPIATIANLYQPSSASSSSFSHPKCMRNIQVEAFNYIDKTLTIIAIYWSHRSQEVFVSSFYRHLIIILLCNFFWPMKTLKLPESCIMKRFRSVRYQLIEIMMVETIIVIRFHWWVLNNRISFDGHLSVWFRLKDIPSCLSIIRRFNRILFYRLGRGSADKLK